MVLPRSRHDSRLFYLLPFASSCTNLAAGRDPAVWIAQRGAVGAFIGISGPLRADTSSRDKTTGTCVVKRKSEPLLL